MFAEHSSHNRKTLRKFSMRNDIDYFPEEIGHDRNPAVSHTEMHGLGISPSNSYFRFLLPNGPCIWRSVYSHAFLNPLTIFITAGHSGESGGESIRESNPCKAGESPHPAPGCCGRWAGRSWVQPSWTWEPSWTRYLLSERRTPRLPPCRCSRGQGTPWARTPLIWSPIHSGDDTMTWTQVTEVPKVWFLYCTSQ